jgi:hypothetical protein
MVAGDDRRTFRERSRPVATLLLPASLGRAARGPRWDVNSLAPGERLLSCFPRARDALR